MAQLEATASPGALPAKHHETIRYSKEEWEQYRPIIEGMYPLKGMNLKGIAAFLREDRGFTVNERQLKRKIKDWKLEKNVKSNEMRVIVRKIQQREAIGKNTIFRVRGQPVDPLKIERWQKRCGDVQPNTGSTSLRLPSPILSPPSTPSDISYDTVHEEQSPSTRSSSPYQRNTTIFGSIDFELGRSLLPSPAIVAPGFGSNHLLNAFDVSRSPRHEFVEGSFGPLAGPPLPPPSFAFEVDTPSSYRRERLLTGSTGASGTPKQGYEEPVQRQNGAAFIASTASDPALREESSASHEKRDSGEHNDLGDSATEQFSSSPAKHLVQKARYKQTEELALIRRFNGVQLKDCLQDPGTVDTAVRLASILSLQGRYRPAELLLKQCLDHFQTTLGKKNPRTLLASAQLGQIYAHQMNLMQADSLSYLAYLRALEVFSPSAVRDFLSIKINFAYCIAISGETAAAERLLREAMTDGRAVLPEDDPKMLECIRYLAELLRIRGEPYEAKYLLQSFAKTSALNQGTFNKSEALLDYTQEQARKVEQDVSVAQEAQNTAFDSEHRPTTSPGASVLRTSSDSGSCTEGEELLQDAINRSARLLWMKQPSTLTKEAILATFLNDPGLFTDATKAKKAATEVLSICGDIFTSEQEISSLTNMILGWSLRRQGRLEDALASMKRALEGYTKTRGSGHALTKECERRAIALTQEIDSRMSPNELPPGAKSLHQVLGGQSRLLRYDVGLFGSELVWTPNSLTLITSDISF